MQQNFKSKNKNIYKVEYIVRSFGTDIYYINIFINNLYLQYYRNDERKSIYNNQGIFKYFYEVEPKGNMEGFSIVPFMYGDIQTKKIQIKYIEINEQLQQLLYSKDEINCSLGTQIIFAKLGINYE